MGCSGSLCGECADNEKVNIMKNLKSEPNGVYSIDAQNEIDNHINEDRIIKEALEIASNRFKRKANAMTSPVATREFLTLYFANDADTSREKFVCVYLDQRHRVIDVCIEATGTIDGASVYPREIVKSALKHNASAVIFAHNHPSGVAEPSQSDERITSRLKKALALVDIRVLDHFVVGEEVVSFAERGLL